MPVTITAGVTFSGGGLTMAFAPPTVATAGWFAGGTAPSMSPNDGTGYASKVSRITFATDTDTGVFRGPLTIGRRWFAGSGNMTYGWFAAGSTYGGPATSAVDRVTYSTDTATMSARGPLTGAKYSAVAAGNNDYGWYMGGTPGATAVIKIDYGNDTATATNRSPLTGNKYYGQTGVTDNTTYGWVAGGRYTYSNVQRITYANDTTTSTNRGPLSTNNIEKMAGVNTSSYGWFGGGYNSTPSAPFPSRVSTIQRIEYANDTATASVRGPLSLKRELGTNGAYSDTYGWFGGGYDGLPGTGQVYYSTVDRITFATDTATASGRGPLSLNPRMNACNSGLQ